MDFLTFRPQQSPGKYTSTIEYDTPLAAWMKFYALLINRVDASKWEIGENGLSELLVTTSDFAREPVLTSLSDFGMGKIAVRPTNSIDSIRFLFPTSKVPRYAFLVTPSATNNPQIQPILTVPPTPHHIHSPIAVGSDSPSINFVFYPKISRGCFDDFQSLLELLQNKSHLKNEQLTIWLLEQAKIVFEKLENYEDCKKKMTDISVEINSKLESLQTPSESNEETEFDRKVAWSDSFTHIEAKNVKSVLDFFLSIEERGKKKSPITKDIVKLMDNFMNETKKIPDFERELSDGLSRCFEILSSMQQQHLEGGHVKSADIMASMRRVIVSCKLWLEKYENDIKEEVQLRVVHVVEFKRNDNHGLFTPNATSGSISLAKVGSMEKNKKIVPKKFEAKNIETRSAFY